MNANFPKASGLRKVDRLKKLKSINVLAPGQHVVYLGGWWAAKLSSFTPSKQFCLINSIRWASLRLTFF